MTHMLCYLTVLAAAVVLLPSANAFDVFPDEREDADGFTKEYVVEFNSRIPLSHAHNVIKMSDFQVKEHHPNLGHVFKLVRSGISRKKRATFLSVRPNLDYFDSNKHVLHASQLENLVRVKRQFDTAFDEDAVITHNKNRDYHYETHKRSDFYRMKFSKKSDNVCNLASFNDPLFSDQWQICNAGQTGGTAGFDNNVLPVWVNRNITGRGVKVCILDDGVDFRHPDLLANFDSRASIDLNNKKKKNDPTPRGNEANAHGTKCAGVVAAVANNNKCGVGIAYNAKIGGIRMLDGQVTDLLEAEALTFNIDYIDIFSASWGPTDDGRTMAGPGKFASRALRTAVTKGRNGLGTVFIWATGNGGRKHDDCNADGYVSNVNVISIGSVDEFGRAPVYMEECSSTMAVVFVGGPKSVAINKPNVKMVTVNINEQCTEDFTGTSAAAPAAAGIVALMLEANPQLSYRGVMHVIVNTAISEGLVADWFTNAAGHRFSRRFGFGRLNADKLVELAQEWKSEIPELHVCESKVKTLSNVEFTARESVTIELESDACEKNTKTWVQFAEHVQLFVDITHPRRGDVNLTLVSPAGTMSTVLGNRPFDTKTNGIRFAFTTIHFWGEPVQGVWKVIVADNPQGGETLGLRRVNRIGLAFLGTTSFVTAPISDDKSNLEDSQIGSNSPEELEDDLEEDDPLTQSSFWRQIFSNSVDKDEEPQAIQTGLFGFHRQVRRF